MPGVRLHHPSLKNCTYTVLHEGRPLVSPSECQVCGITHYHKTYHLGLDDSGDVVVSETVYERLKEADLGELSAKQEVKTPPPIVLNLNGGQEVPVVISRENGGSASRKRKKKGG